MDSSDSEIPSYTDTSSDSETTSSTSFSSASSSKTMYVRVCTSSPLVIDETIKDRFYASYRHQNFSLPDSIMHYMAMNPKNAKNPILVLYDLYYDKNGWTASKDGGWMYINLANVSSKLWITGYVNLHPADAEDKCVTSIIPKIYRCDATMLNITNLTISCDELMFFGSNVDSLGLRKVTVTYKDGSDVAFEKIIQLFPKIKYLNYDPPSHGFAINSKTFKELLKNPQFLKLKGCTFRDISEDFDLDAFYEYMKKNKHTSIKLYFCDTISEAYCNRLQAIVTEIVEAKTHEYKPPYIFFNGLDEKMRDKLWELNRQHSF
uniref:Uncharacterized protein n=1 Tax=Panagrolaimus sp. ES5 TaxID=591445 RepID=A0AC34FT01_9BILA